MTEITLYKSTDCPDEQVTEDILTFSQIIFRAACSSIQVITGPRLVTADKWWRVSPDQSPGPGRIDSGSTGEEQGAEQGSPDQSPGPGMIDSGSTGEDQAAENGSHN